MHTQLQVIQLARKNGTIVAALAGLDDQVHFLRESDAAPFNYKATGGPNAGITQFIVSLAVFDLHDPLSSRSSF